MLALLFLWSSVFFPCTDWSSILWETASFIFYFWINDWLVSNQIGKDNIQRVTLFFIFQPSLFLNLLEMKWFSNNNNNGKVVRSIQQNLIHLGEAERLAFFGRLFCLTIMSIPHKKKVKIKYHLYVMFIRQILCGFPL